MALLKTFFRGESITIGFAIPENYNIDNVDSCKAYLGSKLLTGVFEGRIFKCEIPSDETTSFGTCNKLTFWLDDAVFGVKKIYCGDVEFGLTNATDSNESVNTGFDILVNLIINSTTIAVDNIFYNYFKGDKGDTGEQGIQGVQGEQGIQGVKGDKGDKGEDAVLPPNIVIDANYVHTDNNFTNSEKLSVSEIPNKVDKNGTDRLITLAEVATFNAKQPAGDYATNAQLATKEPANANIQNHISSTSNPHNVTKTQVGLSNVDNTSDVNKPISTATATELDLKVDKVTGSSLVAETEILSNRTTVKKVTTLTVDGGQLTGFVNPIAVDVSYNGATRKVTLTGNVDARWQGIPMTEIVPYFVSGWESEAHNIAEGEYFLSFNGTSFVWSNTPFDFKHLMIAFVYRDGVNVCLRECHGLQDWQSHEANHNNVGTVLRSGADVAGFTLNSDVVANRRPTISQALVYDEDLPSNLPALTNGLYTRLFLDGANNANFETDKTDIVEYTAGNRFLYNLFTGGIWTKATASNNQYAKIFLMAIPTTSDADCQKSRYVWIMPQTVNATLLTIQALTPSSINLAQISTALAEYVFVQEFIIRATASGWTIISTAKLTGNKRFQSVTSGNFLSSVAHNTSMTGDGTSGNPLATTAALIPFTPSGNLTATDVDGALKELDNKKLAITAKITTTNVEAVVDTVFQVPQYISFVKRNDGIGVLGLRFDTTIAHTATISGGGFFYTDSAGTLGQSQTMSVVKGSNILYLRVTTDAVVKLLNVSKIDSAQNSSGNFPEINSLMVSPYLNFLDLGGQYTTPFLGGILTLPSGMTNFVLQGSNAVSGILTLPSGMVYFILDGNNTVSGVLTLPSGMVYFRLFGGNTVTGVLTLPSGMTVFLLGGNNTVSGILTLPSGMVYFILGGNNTVTGVLTLPSGMTNFALTGNNSCSYNLTNTPNACKSLELNSTNGIYTYNTTTGLKVWASGMRRIYIRPKTATWTSAMTDALLIDLLTSGNTWVSEKTVDLRGNCGARTTASDAAVATLQSYGVTVFTN